MSALVAAITWERLVVSLAIGLGVLTVIVAINVELLLKPTSSSTCTLIVKLEDSSLS